MESTLKNTLIAGTVTFFILIAYAFIKVRNSSLEEERLISRAKALAEQAADRDITLNNLFLLYREGGFAPLEIPGIEKSEYDRCLKHAVSLKQFGVIVDVVPAESYEDLIKRYESDPETTFSYAKKYNEIILEYIKNQSVRKCI